MLNQIRTRKNTVLLQQLGRKLLRKWKCTVQQWKKNICFRLRVGGDGIPMLTVVVWMVAGPKSYRITTHLYPDETNVHGAQAAAVNSELPVANIAAVKEIGMALLQYGQT
ncbi:hypothetical protein NPIL_412061 [Nephila pilipes]|uniref:TFIIS N-terminal domain-containing protein n=1 Tax=Nephila pilipes TaxID=299642 RepID=A0A8X6P2H2_NEPPI|nr:hypothetical protein NPIL_412061 [Nephila pilipes]